MIQMKSPTTRSRQTKPLKKAFKGTQLHRERLEAGKMNFEWTAISRKISARNP